MVIQPERPQSIGGVLDTTFQLYKASVAKVWPVCLVAAIASVLPSVYVLSVGGANPLNAVQAMSNSMYWVVYAATLTLSLWVAAALLTQQHGIGVGENPGASGALRAATGRVPALFGMAILFIIALLLGMILLVIPGMILMVSLMLGATLVVLERKGPVEALKGSHTLVWGDWWRSAATVTIAFILVAVVYAAIAFLMGIVIGAVGVSSDDAFLAGMVMALLLSGLMTFIVSPFYTALLITLYWDLKLRKQGGDLAARVAALNPA